MKCKRAEDKRKKAILKKEGHEYDPNQSIFQCTNLLTNDQYTLKINSSILLSLCDDSVLIVTDKSGKTRKFIKRFLDIKHEKTW